MKKRPKVQPFYMDNHRGVPRSVYAPCKKNYDRIEHGKGRSSTTGPLRHRAKKKRV